MEKEKKEYGFHKLEVGQKIRVFKNMFGGKIYYRYQTMQKNYDGTSTRFYISLQFKKNVELDNETDIIVHQFVENMRVNPKDSYNPIHFYQINDFEVVESEEKITQNAFDEFRENLEDNDITIDIDDNFLD